MPQLPARVRRGPSAADLFRLRFARSKRGNLWATVDGRTLTVFLHPRHDLYAYSVADGDAVRFSQPSWATEEDALAALHEELLASGEVSF